MHDIGFKNIYYDLYIYISFSNHLASKISVFFGIISSDEGSNIGYWVSKAFLIARPGNKIFVIQNNFQVLNTSLFKVPHYPLQSTTSPSSKYHTTLFKVSHYRLQSTTLPSSKYHTTLFKVSHQPLQTISKYYII